MKLLIILLIAFIILVYVYNFIRIRKRRKNAVDAVTEFNEKYLKKKTSNKNNTTDINYKKYITKYNSQIDYISKEDL